MSHPKFSPTLLRNPLSLDFNHRQSPTLLSAIGLLTLISLGIVLPYKADGASEPTKQVKVESSQWQSVEDQKETIKRQLSALRDEKFSLKEQLDKVQTQLVKRLPTAEAIESKCYGRAWDEALARP